MTPKEEGSRGGGTTSTMLAARASPRVTDGVARTPSRHGSRRPRRSHARGNHAQIPTNDQGGQHGWPRSGGRHDNDRPGRDDQRGRHDRRCSTWTLEFEVPPFATWSVFFTVLHGMYALTKQPNKDPEQGQRRKEKLGIPGGTCSSEGPPLCRGHCLHRHRGC